MHDPRLDKLANVLTTHSTKIQPGEFVLIEGIDIPQEMVIALIRAVRKADGIPLVELKQNRIQREIILGGDDAGIQLIGEYEIYRMKKVQAYIGIRGNHNITEMSDVPSEAMLIKNITRVRSTISACHRQNGLCYDGPTLRWRSRQR